MKQKNSASAPKLGMQRGTHPSQLENTAYTLGVNINTVNESGDSLNVQLESSNYLAVNFPTDYKVIGFVSDILKERTYYFLTNINVESAEYKKSSIGYVDFSTALSTSNNDTYTEGNCVDCNPLPTPLEDTVQTPSLIYVELVHDACIDIVDLEEQGLNFDINSPIKKIEIKQEVLGTTLYWNDWRNPLRHLKVGAIEESIDNETFDYLHTAYNTEEGCIVEVEAGCLDVTKMLVNPPHKRMVIEAKEEQIGGNLKQGTYEFRGAYCDSQGNEITEYCTATNPISIWDDNNYIQAQTETDEFTNYAIKLKIHNLDTKRFKYYKIAVIERNNVANTQSVFLAGIYATTDNVVTYSHSGSSNDDLYIARGNVSIKKRMDFYELNAIKPNYKRMRGTMVSDDRLFGYGLEEEEEINLQPVVNLFSGLVKAQTSAVSEDLYKSAVASAKYKYYTRNEVQPIGIRLLLDNGGYTPTFPFIGRPKTENDAQKVVMCSPDDGGLIEDVKYVITEIAEGDDFAGTGFTGETGFIFEASGIQPPIWVNGTIVAEVSASSFLEGGQGCSNTAEGCAGTERTEKWQFYNTAEEIEGTCFDIDANSIILPPETIEKIYYEDIPTEIPSGSIELTLEDKFFGLEDFINTHLDEICDGDSPSPYYNETLCDYLSDLYPDVITTPLFPTNCEEGEEGCIPLCTESTLLEEKVIVGLVVNENAVFEEKEEDDYIKTTRAKYCTPYLQKEGELGYVWDEVFMENFSPKICRIVIDSYPIDSYHIEEASRKVVFFRDYDDANEVCQFATTLPTLVDPSQNYETLVMGYDASYTESDLIGDNASFTTTIVDAGFLGTIHNKARFFKVKKNSRDKIVFEITKPTQCQSKGDYLADKDNREVRYVIYDDCITTTELGGGIVNISSGYLEIIDVSTFPEYFIIVLDTKITSETINISCFEDVVEVILSGSSGSAKITIDTADYTFNFTSSLELTAEAFVYTYAADILTNHGALVTSNNGVIVFKRTPLLPPITITTITGTLTGLVNNLLYDSQREVFYVTPPCGCFGVYQRNIENASLTVSWDSISLVKKLTYTAECSTILPKTNDCNPIPFKKYKMAFWESINQYPNNRELFDSSTLKINETHLTDLELIDKTDFVNYYTTGTTDFYGNYILKTEGEGNTNFSCGTYIRHPKFPDNTIAPFILDNNFIGGSIKSTIFPIGINFDGKIVDAMIDVAYDNGLLTKKQKESIVGWEIMKGDNTIHKSVISNGILIDVNKYTEAGGDDIHFSNFPYNNLGVNKFVNDPLTNEPINHIEEGDRNNKFTFISPDMLLKKTAVPTEMSLQGYMAGTANIGFADVEEHPKWTVLGDKTYSTANALAGIELTLEAIILISDRTKEGTAFFGTSSGGNYGWVSAVGAIAGIIFNAAVKLGKYRYDWLKIFRDLGRMDNFASFQYGDGKHNRFLSKSSLNSENYLRRLSVRKYLEEGYYTITDENSGEALKINNRQRERSIFLKTGNHHIEYPTDYKEFDNNILDVSTSSNFLNSESGCTNKISKRNIANPYVSLKNYVPDQWDEIDTIKWLTTNAIFDKGVDTSCEVIYGGTQVISRFSWRTKVPLFTQTAIKSPDKLPYLYSRNSNIGNTRFYCDYETADNNMFNFVSTFFPDIKSETSFDCKTGKSSFYFRPPSKFYLFTHGIIDFLVESEINCNFRYAKKEPYNQFYRNQDLSSWLQEVNLPISEPNTFFYNSTYSLPVSNSQYRYLDNTYSKDIWKKRTLKKNAWVWSEKDNNENALIDPFLIFKPLSFYQDKTNRGELIDLRAIESEQFFGRYEDQLQLFNPANSVADAINTQNKDLGTGFLNNRATTFKKADLGFAGTQNVEFISTPYGHFWCDAKRGKVFKTDQNGGSLEIISEIVNGKDSGMKQWFREHLPFKISKYYPTVDIDNKFKGVGLNMWWDDRESRLFITKRDYIPKQSVDTECIKHTENIGFYEDCVEEVTTCPNGYTYNPDSQLCVFSRTSKDLCPEGYSYDAELNRCFLEETTEATCTLSVCADCGLEMDFTLGVVLNVGQVRSTLGCDVGDYKINWHLGSAEGEIVLITGEGTDLTIQAQHPPLPATLIEAVEPGTLYPVIEYIYLDETKYVSAVEEGATLSEDLATCLYPDGIVVSPITCAYGDSEAVYNFSITHNALDLSENKSRTIKYFISNTTNYFAWLFDAYVVSDQIRLYYCTALDSDGVLLENYILGNTTDVITNLSPIDYPTNPYILRRGTDLSNEALRQVTNLEAKRLSLEIPTYTSGDYIKVKITGNLDTDKTIWDFRAKCLEAFDLDFNTSAISEINLANPPEMTYSSEMCTYSLTYELSESAENTDRAATDYDILKYTSVKGNMSYYGTYYNMFGLTPIPLTLNWQNHVDQQIIGDYNTTCQQLEVGEAVIYNKTSGLFEITFPNATLYDTAVAGIDSVEANPDWMAGKHPMVDPTTDLRAYNQWRIYILSGSVCTGDIDPVQYDTISISNQSVITFDNILRKITFTCPVARAVTYPVSLDDCLNNFVPQLTTLFNRIESDRVSTFNRSVPVAIHNPILGVNLITYDYFETEKVIFCRYQIPINIYEDILSTSYLTANGWCVEGYYWTFYKQYDRLTFTGNTETGQDRLDNWTLERKIKLESPHDCEDTAYEPVYTMIGGIGSWV